MKVRMRQAEGSWFADRDELGKANCEQLIFCAARSNNGTPQFSKKLDRLVNGTRDYPELVNAENPIVARVIS